MSLAGDIKTPVKTYEGSKLHHGVRDLTSCIISTASLSEYDATYPREDTSPCRAYKTSISAVPQPDLQSNSPCDALRSSDLGDSIEGPGRERRNGGLHSDLDGLERAEGDISNDFRRSTGHEVERRLVLLGSLFSSQVRVELLEELVEAVLASSLTIRTSARV